MVAERIILGIDPGTNTLGYGILKCSGKQMQCLAIGIVRMGKIEDGGKKLYHIFQRVSELIAGYGVTEVSVEAPFYGKNVQSMLKLGRAQGVAIAAALAQNKPVFEYSPKKIKQSITGKGASSKEQVAAMLHHLLNFAESPETLDATDGMAAAVCHFFQLTPRPFGEKSASKSKSGWAKFIADNPDKVK